MAVHIMATDKHVASQKNILLAVDTKLCLVYNVQPFSREDNKQSMKRVTIAEKIRIKFNCSIKDFVEAQLEEGNNLNEMAELVPCSPGTLRKLALDNGMSFAEPKKEVAFMIDSNQFKSHRLNTMNVLSRSWAAV